MEVSNRSMLEYRLHSTQDERKEKKTLDRIIKFSYFYGFYDFFDIFLVKSQCFVNVLRVMKFIGLLLNSFFISCIEPSTEGGII